jgi:hypothetical protein
MQTAELTFKLLHYNALAIFGYTNLLLKIKKQVSAKRGSLRVEAFKASSPLAFRVTGFGLI